MGCGASSTGASASNAAGSTAAPKPASTGASASNAVGSTAAPKPASTGASASNAAGSTESAPASQAHSKPASGTTGSARPSYFASEKDAQAYAKSADTASAGNVDKPQKSRVTVMQSSGQLSGALDPEEFDTAGAMEQIRILFDKLDKDGSGLVSKEEFVEEAPKISPKLFAGFDFHRYAGKDSMMSWVQFCAGMRSGGRVTKDVMHDVFKSTTTQKDSEILDVKLKEAKDQFDKVAGLDGVVDIMEFFSKADAMPLFKGVQFARAAGGDNILTFEEFVAALRENGNLPSQTVEKKS